MNKWLKVFVIVIILLLGGFIWLGLYWLNFLNTPLVAIDKPAVHFVLSSGDSVKTLAAKLHNKAILKSPTLFVILARIRGETRRLQAGQYQIEPGLTPIQFLQKLITGQVILHSFTIVPGWTFHKMLIALQGDSDLMHTLAGLNDDAIMQKIGHPGEMPEGRFLPETYKFSTGAKDIDVLRLAYNLMQTTLQQAWHNRFSDVPYSCPYKALIAASMIEKETSLAKERPIISGVIARRIKKNMYLQVDPCVIYGLMETRRDSRAVSLSAADLKKDTPYNTYRHKGLPPTPICLPSTNAIDAALHPMPGIEMYFVAKGDGSHVFSNTLKAHERAIKKYQ